MKALKLFLVWILVVIPLSWGVVKSVEKALPLFRAELKP
jgi:hypothetical protein